MKKLLIILVALCVSVLSYAQKAQYYKFESITGSGLYTPLSEATSLTGASKYKESELEQFKGYVFTTAEETISIDSAKKRDSDITGFPIGFDFTYCGQTYNRFIPISDGYIMLAKDKIDKTKLSSGNSLPTAASIGLIGDNSVKYYPSLGTGISYKTEGSEGSKVLSVEFKNLSYSSLSETKLVDSITYIIRLYETDNRVELYFGNMYMKSSSTWFTVGIAGTTNRDEHYRKPISDSWDNTEYTNRTSSVQNFANKTITRGTTYKFSTPDECIKPTTRATIESQVKSDIIEFWVKMPEDKDGDGYMCIFSNKELTADPINGTIYNEGDSVGGGVVVLFHENRPSSISDNKVKRDDLIPNTKYYIYNYMLNIRCLTGPVYGDKEDTILTTKTTAPAALDLKYQNDTISLSPKSNEFNEKIVVLATTVKGTDLSGNEILVGDFGVLEGEYKVGDTVLTETKTFGGKVIYVGAEPEEAIICPNLKDNVIYHFGAFSRSGTGEYSSVFAQADTITKASIPFFENFKSMPGGEVPYGWGGANVSVQRRNSPYGIEGVIRTGDGNLTNIWMSTPQMLFTAEKDTRLVLDYNMSQYQGRTQVGLKPEHWNEKDSIIISVSEDGKAYKAIYAITKNNADAFADKNTYIKRYINIPGYKGKKSSVKIEYSMKTPITGNTHFRLNNISLVDKPDCDYPVEVMAIDSLVYSDKATIFSKTIGDEQQWKYKYKTPSSDWSKEVLVSSNPFEITALPHRDSIKVAVKAVCALGKESQYTESAYFYSGYQVPFLEDFNKFPVDRIGFKPTVLLPHLISAAMNKLEGEEIILKILSGSQALSVAVPFDMDNNVAYDPKKENTNGGISMPDPYVTKTPWLLLPAVELEENVTANISLDISLRDKNNEFKTPTNVSEGMAFKIMVSTDGKTFKKTNTVFDLDKTSLLGLGEKKNYSVPLTGYKGKVYIGLYYIQDTSSDYESPYVNNVLYIDNIKIAVPCGDVKGIKATEITEVSANVIWNAFPGVSSYKVKFVEVGKSDTTTHETNTNKINLESLIKGTEYRVEVYYMCEEEKSLSAILLFTTAGIDCDVPTALAVSNISKTSARLSWSGEAASYRVGIKSVNEEDFITQETEKKTLDMQSLAPGTRYVFRVKALCSDADTSVWSDTIGFTTNTITCFPPTEIVIEPLFVSAKVSYKGAADKYQIAYRQGEEGGTNPWIIKNVEGKEFELEELQPKKKYQLKVRSVCSAGDTSEYSAIKAFTTVEIPICPIVTDLKVSDTTKNSAKLTWISNEENTGYIVRYRAINATKWDSIKELTKTEYNLGSLEKNTAYTWTVNASCSYERWSGWATQVNFTTLDEVSVEENLNAYFHIYASNGTITLINTMGIMVNEISIYTTNGQKVDSYKTKTNYNAVIPTKLKAAPAMVVVSTEKGTAVFKIMLP